ncbi:MAG: DUF4118 domain-containing protein [Gemmatimonadaceae bacterium]|nr:DUF4118 domain-containing protein [Gemmatimonadaceae bacterium]
MMRAFRGQIDQAHVVLVYLLVVLGGSATGGRAPGLVLAGVSFLLIDYYFQPPYDFLTVGKPLDWLVLVAFLATATVSTQLLARARAEAEEARRRAMEVSSLAQLGSETLSAGRAEEALERVVEVIQGTLSIATCAVYPWDASVGFGAEVTRDGTGKSGVPVPDSVRLAVERSRRPSLPFALTLGSAAGSAESDGVGVEDGRELALPLRVQQRVVGVLRLANDTPITLGASQRRFLDALGYYAALAVERVRLVSEAEHAEALREADRMREELLASISHDLRTPLTTIKALAQTAALAGDAAAAAIEEQADAMARLVGDLLDMSRLRAGTIRLKPEFNTAEDLIGATTRQLRGILNGRTLRTKVDVTGPALVGRFDFVHTLRVLGNLLENAVRYAPADQPIDLVARRDGAWLEFVVADRGPGVPPASLERIFEPFIRAPGVPPDAGRAGLGLSIARQLAELQDGQVVYQPREGGGSCFVLRVPAVDLEPEPL